MTEESSTTVQLRSTSGICGCRTTHIYCRPDCPAGKRTKPENRVFFSSCEEARTNGYRPCKVCKPDTPETLLLKHYDSPLGTYILVSSQRGVVCVEPEDEAKTRLARWERDGIQMIDGGEHNDIVAAQLSAYFAARLRQFSVSLDLRGTLFQRQVWELLRGIPYGETRSYGYISHALGRPTAARAVGQANGRNPVSIIVPCHRVIGANGKLTGYGGGLHRKQALLDLEAAVISKGSI